MILKETDINQYIKQHRLNTNLISDGYHTFGELYDHRIQLFINLCSARRVIEDFVGDDPEDSLVWRSVAHSDGTVWENWFILGYGIAAGEQITYHLPMSAWEKTNFARTLIKAPAFDGHTSADVLVRLQQIITGKQVANEPAV